ncbi:RmlC-like cupin domain-containing protein [Aspergillus unguis]
MHLKHQSRLTIPPQQTSSTKMSSLSDPESQSLSQPQPILYSPETITSLPHESFQPSHPSPNQTSPHGTVTWRTLLSTPNTPSTSLSAGLASCAPYTGSLALHRHTQAEIYYITSGSGVVIIEGTEHRVSAGSVVFIPGDAEHGVRNEESEALEWFYVFPTGAFGDVIYRFSGDECCGS